MPVMEEFGSFLRTMRVYLLGRGLVSLGVIAATMASSTFSGLTILGVAPALVIAVGGALVTGFLRIHAQREYETNMVDLYRDDIAQKLGIAPNEVTRADLKTAARDNDVIAQALHRQERKNVISFATAALAAISTFGLITFALAPSAVAAFLTPHLTAATLALGAPATAAAAVAKFAGFLSTGIVAGVSSLIVHDGLEAAIGRGTGLSKAAAHDLIFAMNRDVKHGRSISAAQVYGVLVAGDPALQQAIETQFKKPYAEMNGREQRHVLRTIGVGMEMQLLATDISRGALEAGHLAFIINDARTLDRPAVAVAEPSPTNGQFVERLGLAPRAQKSFAEQVSERPVDTTQLVRG
ncbi:MAG: hypothetical protein V4735_05270 [Pseudomonadota bacterium]